ncbi:adhesion G protein-coupled receptor E1-like [Sardina pilchardus]|uniref:adhesion G protein-coupled receptor E1-like n=1 Tax=Sardina pilchardus TaxID=27697 RepID=UPI002E102FF7
MRVSLIIVVSAWYSILRSAGARDDCKYSVVPKKCWPPEDDVDECALNPRICGDEHAICTNRRRGYLCECPEGFLPSPSINWRVDVTVCKELDKVIPGREKDKKQRVDKVLAMVRNITTEERLPLKTVSLLLDMLGDDDKQRPVKHRDDVLRSRKKLVAKLVERTSTQDSMNFTTNSTEGEILSIGPNTSLSGFPRLRIPSGRVFLDIDLLGIAKKNNGSASVILVAYRDMEDILEASLFHSKRNTTKEIISRVVSATIEDVEDANLTDLIKFTLLHNYPQKYKGVLSCVYWNGYGWEANGCRVSRTNATHTVCACEHLSTFSLISERYGKSFFAMVLDTAALVSGPVLLLLTVLTLALYRNNRQVTTVPRFHVAACLLVANPIYLTTQNIYLSDKLCIVLPGVSTYFYLCCFMWTTIEAFLLLSSTKKHRVATANVEDLPTWSRMYCLAYGMPLLITAVSAGTMSGLYGGPQCWLSSEDGFNWVFLGPTFLVLVANSVLYGRIFIILLPTLKHTDFIRTPTSERTPTRRRRNAIE